MSNPKDWHERYGVNPSQYSSGSSRGPAGRKPDPLSQGAEVAYQGWQYEEKQNNRQEPIEGTVQDEKQNEPLFDLKGLKSKFNPSKLFYPKVPGQKALIERGGPAVLVSIFYGFGVAFILSILGINPGWTALLTALMIWTVYLPSVRKAPLKRVPIIVTVYIIFMMVHAVNSWLAPF